MDNPSDYLKDLQEAEAAQGAAQLRTLVLEFAATLKRLPRLKQEIDDWLENTQSGADFNLLATRLEPQLVFATDWLYEYDLLPYVIQNAQVMKDFMVSISCNATSRTFATMVKKFQDVKKAAEKSTAAPNSMLALGYVDNGDGTITDNNTGLMWKKRREVGTYTYDEVANRFSGKEEIIRLNGFSDWRLPTINELKTLIHTGNSPVVCEEAFPDSLMWFWSSSARDSSSAWVVHLGDGSVYSYRTYECAVRLVRADY